MSDSAITIQVVYGSVGVTARLDGTSYSPDVFDDVIRKCVNGVCDAVNSADPGAPPGDARDGYETFVTFMEARMQDED